MHNSPAKMMSAALKKSFVPTVQESGFIGTFPDFKRRRPECLDFLSIQFDKAGRSFLVEIGVHPPADLLTSWGEVVPEGEITMEYVDFNSRARVTYPSGRWFAFGRFGAESEPYVNVAKDAAQLLPQIEAWFNNRTASPNIKLMASNNSFNSGAGKGGAG